MSDDPTIDGIKALERVIEQWRRLGAEAEYLATALGEASFPVGYVQERLCEYSTNLLMAAGIAESNLIMFQEAVYLSAMREAEPDE